MKGFPILDGIVLDQEAQALLQMHGSVPRTEIKRREIIHFVIADGAAGDLYAADIGVDGRAVGGVVASEGVIGKSDGGEVEIDAAAHPA